ncbi:unnamed protein product [Allacma fusca]|uniref:Theromacin n=1 Tax=Allacma fusca TaxID=39272 RepID=A0A8J2LMP1_9HEXA|nr:unnamed protein product [Allacma fusca]
MLSPGQTQVVDNNSTQRKKKFVVGKNYLPVRCLLRMKSIVFLMATLTVVAMVQGSCWSDWSRCTSWSSAGNNILWQDCTKRCICRGYAGGRCVLVPTTCSLLPKVTKVGQCQCRGRYNGKKPSWCGF